MAFGAWREERVADLACWVRGEGRGLLLLHGGPGLSDYTEHLGDLLAGEFGDDRWAVARFQQRGLAPSTTEGPFTVDQHVADALQVCDWLTRDPVVVVGHSWGAHLAMHMAVAAPDRLAAAVIIDPLGAVADGGAAAMSAHFASRLTEDEAAARARIAVRSATESALDELAVADLEIVWRYYFADPEAAPSMPQMRMSVDAHVQTFASFGEHFARETLVRGLAAASTPTLFVAGTRSPIPHSEAERSAALMPNARVATRPTGHFPWLEDPEWAASTIAEFLNESLGRGH